MPILMEVFGTMAKQRCEECLGGVLDFDGPCPVCGGKGYVGSPRRAGKGGSDSSFLAEVKRKLESPEWEEMVRRAREQVGLPAEGLEPEVGGDLLAGAVVPLLLSYASLHPTVGPQLAGEAAEQPPDRLSTLSEDDLARGMRALSLGSPARLFNIRLAAGHLASWLGVDNEGWVMTYLISPRRWPLDRWKPEPEGKAGLTRFRVFVDLFRSLFPVFDSPRSLKAVLLRGFAKGGRIILPEVEGEQATWEQLTDVWNALFPGWRFDHWRNFRKAYYYSVRRLVSK